MALSTTTTTASNLFLKYPEPHRRAACFQSQFKLSFPFPTKTTTPLKHFSCYAKAAKPNGGSVKKRSNPNASKKKKKPNYPNNKTTTPTKTTTSTTAVAFDVEEDVEDDDDDYGDDGVEVVSDRYQPLPLPKPPAGFVVDDQGRVLMASNKRIATIVDSTNNLPLECIIRRVFRSSAGDECMLLCPIDMPVQILKSTNFEGWSAVSDDEVEAILPTAAYALAKIHMHLVHSGFCYTARGGFCYTEDDILEFCTGNTLTL